MICHQYKCVFIHIPKNAGQSIEHVFLNLLGLNWKTRAPLLLKYNDRPELGPARLAHMKVEEYVHYKYLTQETFDNYFKFAFVRNPWSRMVSIYKHLKFNKKCDFQTFLMRELENDIFKKKPWFVGPQCDFLYKDNGDLLVNYVGRFEDLQNGFDYVSEKIGIPPTQVPHVNAAKGKNSIFSLKLKRMAKFFLGKTHDKIMPAYSTYQEYYDQDSIDFVAELYRKDIDLFNYKFE